MGFAGSKSRLKLIDTDSAPGRGGNASRAEPAIGMRAGSAWRDGSGGTTGQESEIGPILCSVRERSGQDLSEVSRHLRIRREYLQALEDGNFAALPGMTYAIGYVRTYAQYLGLDAERAIALFKSEAQELEGPRRLVFPSPAPEGKVPGGAVMLVALVLAATAYAGWYYLNASGRAVADYTPAIPESLQSWLGQD